MKIIYFIVTEDYLSASYSAYILPVFAKKFYSNPQWNRKEANKKLVSISLEGSVAMITLKLEDLKASVNDN